MPRRPDCSTGYWPPPGRGIEPTGTRRLHLGSSRRSTGRAWRQPISDRLPPTPAECTRDQLDCLRAALAGRSYPDAPSRSAYAELCRAVSAASALRWAGQLESSGIARETMLWRLLRIGNAPYFVLGHDRRSGLPGRYRIAGPWDWREQFELEEFSVAAAAAGQPRVDWTCTYRARHGGAGSTVAGHVEIRWSHGRFAQPPEAKIYLDTPMSGLPGYYPLHDPDQHQLTLVVDGPVRPW